MTVDVSGGSTEKQWREAATDRDRAPSVVTFWVSWKTNSPAARKRTKLSTPRSIPSSRQDQIIDRDIERRVEQMPQVSEHVGDLAAAKLAHRHVPT